MRVLNTIAETLALSVSFVAAASPAQTTKALQDLAAFSKHFTKSVYPSVIAEVVHAVPATVLESVIAGASGTANPVLANDGLTLPNGMSKFATDPIAALSAVSTPALFHVLPASVRSNILALETKIDYKQASIIRSDLGITTGGAASMPTTSSSNGGAGGAPSGQGKPTKKTPNAAPTGLGVRIAGAAVGAMGVGIALL